MPYLGIDQHKDQLTINRRNEQGDVVQKLDGGDYFQRCPMPYTSIPGSSFNFI